MLTSKHGGDIIENSGSKDESMDDVAIVFYGSDEDHVLEINRDTDIQSPNIYWELKTPELVKKGPCFSSAQAALDHYESTHLSA